jgi:nucleoside-diphosphate-sugar epimerase
MKEKVLVVGGAGYIGGFLTDQLIKNGNHITVYDNLMYEERYLKKVSFINGDIRDRNKLLKIIPSFDIVVWLAAIVGDGACAVDPFLTRSINEDSVKWLVDNFPDKKIVFTSTCSVYGINNDLIDEEAEPNPISIYAETKLEAEQYIIKNHNNYLIFRLGTLFGLGDEHSRIRFDLVSNILTKKATLGQPITVFGGEQWRPLLHVKDVSHAIIFGIENKINGLFNLSYGNFIIKDIAEVIKRCIPESEIIYQDMPFEDLRNYRVRNDKIVERGWFPTLTIRDGIEELRDVILEKRIKHLDNPIYSNEGYLNKNYFKI